MTSDSNLSSRRPEGNSPPNSALPDDATLPEQAPKPGLTSSPNGATAFSPTRGSNEAVMSPDSVPPDAQPHSTELKSSGVSASGSLVQARAARLKRSPFPLELFILVAVAVMLLGLAIGNRWLGIAGAVVVLLVCLQTIGTALLKALTEWLSPQERLLLISAISATAAVIALLQLSGLGRRLGAWYLQLNWDALGATGEVIGAVGQILIAVLAVYIAWRQYVISKDLTIQQNTITQQQTIDSYFQGISELVLDEDGLLEDWPQERAIAEGRTAAILSSVDASGKAKIVRFLSRSRLLSPLQRDQRLGRAILDGTGGYAEDRDYGTRVIDLGVMLAGTDLSGTDLRWTDLSDINLIRANLSRCDLVRTNLARTILCGATLAGSDMMGTRLFYGSGKLASPRTRADVPDYELGKYTGAVVEGADFTNVQRLSEEQRYYCCAWGGSATRETIPGGCEGIPNLVER
jgi:uncharacterized protein YjbI with pentapeptide repeats